MRSSYLHRTNDLPCKNEGMSDLDDVSQCSSEPSSEQVNRWSGLVGWKWTSHTTQTKRGELRTAKQHHGNEAGSTADYTVYCLTFSRVRLHKCEGCIALSHIPDTEHTVLASCGHNMLLIRVSVHAVQRHSVPRP